jgi:hypothetical protein
MDGSTERCVMLGSRVEVIVGIQLVVVIVVRIILGSLVIGVSIRPL